MEDKNRKNEDSIEDKNTLAIIQALKEKTPHTFDPQWIRSQADDYSPETVACEKCGAPALSTVVHGGKASDRAIRCPYCFHTS